MVLVENKPIKLEIGERIMGIRELSQRLSLVGQNANSTRRAKQSRRALAIENLESRQLMAADVITEFNPHSGVLEIRLAPDQVFVNVLSTNGDNPHGKVLVNHQDINVRADHVREIHVQGSRANNQIHLEHVHGNNFRSLTKTEIYGKAGNDTIYGSQVTDYIWGGKGHDDIYGNGGRDWLFGQSGNDHISGGADVDHIYGGAGNDWMWGNDKSINHSDNARDFIYGQGGQDFAFVGKDDLWDRIFSAKKHRRRWA